MRLLMLVPYYAPDLGPSAPLFTMLSEELVRRGHQVRVIAAVPHYPSGSVPKPFRKHWIQRTIENGVEVVRVRIPSVKRSRISQRLIQYLIYQIGAIFAGTGLKYDAAFVANPALWVILPFTWLIAIRHIPATFSIHDVYPDVGVSLGIFRNKLTINAVESMERFCLKRSKSVRILSDSFRSSLYRLGVPDSKLYLIYDWVDCELIQPLSRNNTFSQQNKFNNKFVILYAGNIGLSQGLEHVLAAAKQLENHPDLLFVFVGDGSGKEMLVKQAEKECLSNVVFLPFQPREKLPEVLACANISLIALKKGITAGSLPSKILSGLASGRPLLVSVDENSDSWEIVKRAKAGLHVPPEDSSELAKAILKLSQNPDLCDQLGKNGRLWAEKNHSPKAAAAKFEQIFDSIVTNKKLNLS